MNRRHFVLSWGRKLFFGLAWPLFSMIGLIYLQSFVLPRTTLESFYLLVSYIGHYGAIASLSYFLLYCPVILIFPTYYFSRIWSLIVILFVSSMIFFDAYIFSQFRFHLNQFFFNLFYQKGLQGIISTKATIILFIVSLFVGSIVVWFRGNMSWRSMQKRFSNPVSNWYLVLIVVCLGVSHIVRKYTSKPMDRMTTLFPASFILSGTFKNPQVQDDGRLYYPRDEFKCVGKSNSNIVFIVLKGFPSEDLTLDKLPHLFHLKSHASFWNTHYSGSTGALGGLFSLLYSVSPTYIDAFRRENKRPVFFDELERRKYQTAFFLPSDPGNGFAPFFSQIKGEEIVNGSIVESWKKWHSVKKDNPFYSFFYFNVSHDQSEAGSTEWTRVDREIRSLLLTMLHDHALKNTTVVITGSHGLDNGNGEITEDKLKTPLLVIWPNRHQQEFTQVSSHYDVIPTLMRELWNCKTPFNAYSMGRSLNDLSPHPWQLIEFDNAFALMDLEKGNFSRITAKGGFEVKDFFAKELPRSKGRTELTLKALKENYRFYKR